MHKHIQRIHAPHISEGLCHKLRQQPIGITQMVIDAVTQYNKMLPPLGRFERKDGNERLIKEAEEEATKMFLDGIFDIMQRGNS